jgi:hypothetical protein
MLCFQKVKWNLFGRRECFIYNPKDINPCTKTSYEQLYNKTLNKQIFCEKEGFTYIYIWESEWIRGKNAVISLQKKYFGRFK